MARTAVGMDSGSGAGSFGWLGPFARGEFVSGLFASVIPLDVVSDSLLGGFLDIRVATQYRQGNALVSQDFQQFEGVVCGSMVDNGGATFSPADRLKSLWVPCFEHVFIPLGLRFDVHTWLVVRARNHADAQDNFRCHVCTRCGISLPGPHATRGVEVVA